MNVGFVCDWGIARRSAVGLSAAVVALALGCGPTATDETSGANPTTDDSSGDDAVATSAPATTTSGMPVPTSGPQETGPDDTTGSMPTDFPEYCSTFMQDCPEGYKCMPYANDGGSAWNDVRCVEIVDDPNGVGEPCTVVDSGVSGLDDCDGTSMCWNVNTKTLEGECISFCGGDITEPTCPEPCDSCSISGDGVLNICLSGCDPIGQDCPEGQGCYPVNDSFICSPDASGATGAAGDPCEFINACDSGLACISSDAVPSCKSTAGCCSPYCTVGGPDTCDAVLPGTSCQPYLTEPPRPDTCMLGEVGVCAGPLSAPTSPEF